MKQMLASSHERCSLKVKMPESTRQEYLVEIAEEFASDAVECIAFGSMTALLEEYEFQLCKNASFHYFGLQEDIEYHRLVENIVGNIPAIKRASLFDKWPKVFQGGTAIVCGAGPSLATYYELLHAAKGSYPIIAGGSAISLLTHEGIIPDMGVAVDPNKTELERLHCIDPNMPFIFSGRLHPGILTHHVGPTIYYTSQTGGVFEREIIHALGLSYSEEELALFQSTTIASMCLEVACKLGCSTITLVGFDLAYVDGQRYPQSRPKTFGQVEHTYQRSHTKKIYEINREGKKIETTILWKMERDALARLVNMRKNHLFFALEHDGLIIPDISFITTLPPPSHHDVEKLLTATIEIHRHTASSKIDAMLHRALESLCMAEKIMERILEEIESKTPRYPLIDVLLLDLQEEYAYELFLKATLVTLERLVSRKIHDFNSLKNKSLYIIQLIQRYREILQSTPSFRGF